MFDRRRCPRYVFFAPVDAQTRVVCEAVIESWDGDCAVVTTADAVAVGDDVIIRSTSSSEEPEACLARVISSTPAPGDDGRMRLILSISERSSGSLSNAGILPL